jgi:hypothetical protein
MERFVALRPFRDGLPELSGRSLTAYRIVWVVALVGALAVAADAGFTVSRAGPAALLRLAQAAVLISVAAILFRRRPRDPVAAMLALAFLIWAITGAQAEAGSFPLWLAALDRLRFLLLVGAVLLFPSGRLEPRWAAHALAVSFLVFVLGLAGLAGILPEAWFLPPAVLCVVAAIAALAVRLHRAPPCTQRQQLKWVAFGLAAGLALILVYRIGTALAPDGPGGLLLEAAFRSGVMLMALGFLVSLLRYRLYDAETAISRSAAYVALTLILVAIFAASEAAIELTGQRFLGGRVGDLSGKMAAAIAAVLIAPLHQRISQWAEQRFHRELVILRTELPALLAGAPDHAEIGSLAAMVLPRLEAGVRARHAALAVDGTVIAVNDMDEAGAQAWLERRHAADGAGLAESDVDDPVFPLRIPLSSPGATPFGWVLLGPRPDGSFYRDDELEALAEIAVPLRRAVAAVRDRQRHGAELRGQRDALLEGLSALGARVAMLERSARRGAGMRFLHRSHAEPEV